MRFKACVDAEARLVSGTGGGGDPSSYSSQALGGSGTPLSREMHDAGDDIPRGTMRDGSEGPAFSDT